MLQQPRDRDVPLGESFGDPREDARPVLDLEVEVERRAMLARLEPWERPPRGVVLEEAGAHRPDHADHVRDHSGSGLDAAGAGPFERDLADRVALEHDALNAPSTAASGWWRSTKAGPTRTSTFPSSRRAAPISRNTISRSRAAATARGSIG